MYAPIPFFSPALGESAQNSEPTISIHHKSNNFTIGWNLRSPNVVISGSTSDWKNRNLMLSAWVCQDAQTRSEVLLSSTQDLRSEQQAWHLKNLSIFYMDVSENSGTPKSIHSNRVSIRNHPFWGTPIFGNIHIDKEIVYTINGTCIKNQGFLETFGQFASPPKGHQFSWTSRLERCAMIIAEAPEVEQQFKIYQKWSTVKLRKFLAPKMTWIQVGEIW